MGRIQQSHPDHDLLNRKIRRIVRGLMELEDEALDAGLEPSPESLADAYLHRQTRAATISEWVEAVVTPSARRQVTKDGYRTLVNSLNSFHPGLLTSSLVRYFYLPHDGTYGFKGVSEDLTGDAG